MAFFIAISKCRKESTFVKNSDGNTEKISWIVSDLDYNSTALYRIYQNGSLLLSDSWNTNDIIEISLIGYTHGSYEFRLEIEDGFGLSIEDLVIIEIEEVSGSSDNGNDEGPNNNSLYIIIGAGTTGLIAVAVIISVIKKKGN